MEIDLIELRIILDRLFDRLEEVYPEGKVPFKKIDYYWHIPSDKLYDVTKRLEPDDILIGQLSEDLDMVKKLKDPEIFPISPYLGKLGIILRAIADLKGERVW